jgi:hypothetical protein
VVNHRNISIVDAQHVFETYEKHALHQTCV